MESTIVFQGFHSLQNILTSLKAAVLAPAVRMVDPEKGNRPFPCHEFQSNHIITVPSLNSRRKVKEQIRKFLESYEIRENKVTVNWTFITPYL